MRGVTIACLGISLVLAGYHSVHAQNEKPIDFASKPLAKWIEDLKNDNPETRETARRALGPNGPYAKEAVAALIESFSHKIVPCDDAIGTLADHGPAAIPALVKALKRPEIPVRTAAAEALGDIRPKATDAVPGLVEAMKDSSSEMRSVTVTSLGKIRQPIDKVFPAMAVALRDSEDEVRIATASALKEMRRKSKPVLPALITALNDENANVRELVCSAIGAIGTDAQTAVPALINGLRDNKRAESHTSFAWAIGQIKSDAKDAVPVLIDAIRSKELRLRVAAAEALGEFGVHAKAAVPRLIEMIGSKDKDERRNSIIALGMIGPEAKNAVRTLIPVAKNSLDDACYDAVRAIGKIGPGAKEAVPLLVDRLSYRGTEAAQALGGIGPLAKDAIPSLDARVRNPLIDTHERKAAADAILKIDPDFAKKNEIELAYIDIRLGKLAPIKLGPRASMTDEKRRQIKKLIAELAEMTDPDFGLSGTLSGRAFAPIPGREQTGMLLLTDHQLKTADTFRKLVEMGPDALPFLLEALDDKTPTKLKVDGPGMRCLGTELDGNPLNAVERRVLEARSMQDDDDDDEADLDTVKVGDICFVAIGQIVGRPYSAVRYQPTLMIVINSPVQSKELRDNVRAIWSSKDPTQKLLDSLLIDYATEGFFTGKSFDPGNTAQEYQIEAATRLLYYFPKESAPLIAERLNRLNVKKTTDDDRTNREITNGIEAVDFLKSLTWCDLPAIRDAMFDIFKRTDDDDITLAVCSSVNKSRRELVIPRLRTMLKKLPHSESWHRETGYRILGALMQFAGKDVKNDFKEYLSNGSAQRAATVCSVLEEAHVDWALEFLTPILNDKRNVNKYRLCDFAASAIGELYPDLEFNLSDTQAERDRQIEKLKEELTKKKP